MSATTTRKMTPTSNRGGTSTHYGSTLHFSVLYVTREGELAHFIHSDPRSSVKTVLDRLGVDFDEAIVESFRA